MSGKLRQLAVITAGLLLAVGLASCDERGDTASGDSSSKSSAESSSAGDGQDSSPSESDEGDEGDDGHEPGSDSEVLTLSGTVTAGVEPNCLMLESDGEKYQLIGDKARKLKVGAEVKVTGKVSEKAMTTCMEGRVFEVDSVTTL